MKHIDSILVIPSYKEEEFLSIISSMNRALVKLNLKKLDVTQIRVFEKVVGKKLADTINVDYQIHASQFLPNIYNYVFKCIEYKVVGELPMVEGDWEVIGKVDFESENVVTSFNKQEMNKKYRSIDCTCNHCEHKRSRKTVFIVTNDIEELQIGSSCLNAFTGDKLALKITKLHNSFLSLNDLAERDEDSISRTNIIQRYNLKTFLLITLKLSQDVGFVSSKQASDSLPATSFGVIMLITTKNEDELKYLHKLYSSVTDEEEKLIDDLIEKHSNDKNIDTQSDFEYRMSQIAFNSQLTSKEAGIAVYIIKNYLDSIKTKEDVNNEYRTELLKTRVNNIKLKSVRSTPVRTFYGVSYMNVFLDDMNRTVTSFSTNKFDSDMVADFTIKEFKEFKGIKQTIVSRIKCVEVL